MSKKTRTILLVILAILLVGELVFLAVRNIDFGASPATETVATEPTEAPAEAPNTSGDAIGF